MTVELAEPVSSKRTASPETKTSAALFFSQPVPVEEASSQELELPPAQVTVLAARVEPTVRVMAEPVLARVQG